MSSFSVTPSIAALAFAFLCKSSGTSLRLIAATRHLQSLLWIKALQLFE